MRWTRRFKHLEKRLRLALLVDFLFFAHVTEHRVDEIHDWLDVSDQLVLAGIVDFDEDTLEVLLLDVELSCLYLLHRGNTNRALSAQLANDLCHVLPSQSISTSLPESMELLRQGPSPHCFLDKHMCPNDAKETLPASAPCLRCRLELRFGSQADRRAGNSKLGVHMLGSTLLADSHWTANLEKSTSCT